MSAPQPRKETVIEPLSIYVHPASVPTKGQLFDVTVDAPDGEVIVQGERDPVHVAARVLENRRSGNRPLHAFAPSLTVPDKWTATLRYRKLSDAASRHSRETDLVGPLVVRFRPFEIAGKAAA